MNDERSADRARALRYIAALQRRGNPARPPMEPTAAFELSMRLARSAWPDTSEEERERRVRISLRDVHVQGSADLPDEDTSFRFVIDRLSAAIEQEILARQLTLDPPPIFAALDTGQVNAVTTVVPGTSQHVVFLEQELFMFALLFSKAVARAVPFDGFADNGMLAFSTRPDRIRQWIRDDPSIVARFADVVLAYAIEGRPSAARQYVVEKYHFKLATMLCDSMEMFVVGHEYAHITAGHLNSAGTGRGVADDESADRMVYSWQNELDADGIGLSYSMLAMSTADVGVSQSFSGADLFFSASTIMDLCVSALATGDERLRTLGSHPPAQMRRGTLRYVLGLLIGEERTAGPLQFADAVNLIVFELWEAMRPIVDELRRDGVTPARKWLRQLR